MNEFCFKYNLDSKRENIKDVLETILDSVVYNNHVKQIDIKAFDPWFIAILDGVWIIHQNDYIEKKAEYKKDSER